MTGCDKKQCCCNSKVKNKSTETNDKPYTPSGTGLSFAVCHLTLPQQEDRFQILVDSGSSKHFIDPELIRGVEARMLEYTKKEPPMEIRAAGDNMLYVTAQGILLVVVGGTDDVLRKVELPIVLVPGLKRDIFSSWAAGQKNVKTVIVKSV